MQTPARVALAVGGGYLLGRTKKLRFAMTLAGLVAGKKMDTGALLESSLGSLRDSPEFDRLRTQLMGAGRTAAVSAAAGHLGRLSDRLESGGGKKATAVLEAGGSDEDETDDEFEDYEPDDGADDAAEDLDDDAADEDDEGAQDEEVEDDEDDEDEAEDAEEDEEDEDEDAEEDEPVAEKPARRTSRSRESSSRKAQPRKSSTAKAPAKKTSAKKEK